jgi:hypothetical protein
MTREAGGVSHVVHDLMNQLFVEGRAALHDTEQLSLVKPHYVEQTERDHTEWDERASRG